MDRKSCQVDFTLSRGAGLSPRAQLKYAPAVRLFPRELSLSPALTGRMSAIAGRLRTKRQVLAAFALLAHLALLDNFWQCLMKCIRAAAIPGVTFMKIKGLPARISSGQWHSVAHCCT